MTHQFFTGEVEALRKELLDKKTEYQQAIYNGAEFNELKKIYLEIKELEKKITLALKRATHMQPLSLSVFSIPS